MDDPILWGILPLSYLFSPSNMRWGLGSYDLCFTNKYARRYLRSAHTDPGQGTLDLLHLGPGLAYAPDCAFAIRGPLPAHHDAGDPPPLARPVPARA
jgi:hypothetical protein